MIKITERILTLNQPLYPKVGLEVQMHMVIHILIRILSLRRKMLLQLGLVVIVRFRLHACNSLELRTFVYAEDQNDVVTFLKCLLQFLSRF